MGFKIIQWTWVMDFMDLREVDNGFQDYPVDLGNVFRGSVEGG